MKTVLVLAGVAAGMLLAGPVSASPCGDRIAALDARLDEEAETAISASSGGQGVAGAREGQAMQDEDGEIPPNEPAVPFQSEPQEASATERAVEAGEAGNLVMQAKATLNRARTLDQEGNAAGCEEALAEAERQIEAEE
jgi:hypothetical protein